EARWQRGRRWQTTLLADQAERIGEGSHLHHHLPRSRRGGVLLHFRLTESCHFAVTIYLITASHRRDRVSTRQTDQYSARTSVDRGVGTGPAGRTFLREGCSHAIHHHARRHRAFL